MGGVCYTESVAGGKPATELNPGLVSRSRLIQGGGYGVRELFGGGYGQGIHGRPVLRRLPVGRPPGIVGGHQPAPLLTVSAVALL